MTNTHPRRFALAVLVLGLAVSAPAADAIVPLPAIITLGPASFQVQGCQWEHAYLDYEFTSPYPTFAYEPPVAAFRVEEGAPSVSLAAPVHLPEGAEVTAVIVNYYDTDPASEPSMGLYAIGSGGRMTRIVDASGRPGYAEGEVTLRYNVRPFHVPAGTPFEFRVTLNRSVKDPTRENALFRVQITYRMPLYSR
jgi:hypothetical protein